MSSTADEDLRRDPAGEDLAPYVSIPPAMAGEGEDMPRVVFTRRRMVLFGVFVVSAVAFLYFVLPKLAGSNGLRDSWSKLDKGDPWWLGLAGLFECLSFAGYVALFRAVFVRGRSMVDWRESYQITMAGLAATRLFAAAGAGGVALTAWALRRSGMEARIVACRMIAFMVLLYGVYMATLVVDGLGLASGVFAGPHPFAITVVPAIFGASVILVLLAISLLPEDFERRLAHWASGRGRAAQVARRAATAPASLASGVRTALALIRRGELGVAGAIAWWGFDMAVLWACFRAFGGAPPTGVIVMAYFVGMLANVLPLPGGIGGVDGGMIGALVAFGADFDIALVAVLSYRVFSFWIPTAPGIVAYLQLRRTVSRWGEERATSTA
jgi:uncharacterized protein (TIRG00374 family)